MPNHPPSPRLIEIARLKQQLAEIEKKINDRHHRRRDQLTGWLGRAKGLRRQICLLSMMTCKQFDAKCQSGASQP
jgi:hypothetical protein